MHTARPLRRPLELMLWMCAAVALTASLGILPGGSPLGLRDAEKACALRPTGAEAARAPALRADRLGRLLGLRPTAPASAPLESAPCGVFPWELLGTLVSALPAWSFASVQSREGRRPLSVWAGDCLPLEGEACATVLAVERTRLAVLRGGQREWLELSGRSPAVTPAAPRPLAQPIRESSPGSRVVSRALLEDALAHLDQLASDARAIPAFRSGEMIGFKLLFVRPESLLANLGLKIGDTLLRVNGDALDSPERVLELLVKLRQAQRLELALERESGPLQLRYQIQ